MSLRYITSLDVLYSVTALFINLYLPFSLPTISELLDYHSLACKKILKITCLPSLCYWLLFMITFKSSHLFLLQKGVPICWLLEALKAFFNGTNVMIKLVLFESTHFTKQYHSKVINFLFLVWESFSQFNWLNKKVRIIDKNFKWPFFSKLFSYLIRQKFQGLGNDKKTCSCRQFISLKGKLLP